jgi:8-oxo-dGTP diphosphatase
MQLLDEMRRDPVPRIGVGVIITKSNSVLLLRRRNVHGSGTWSTPGGHLEFGESPEQCAIREACEETSVKVESLDFRGVTNDIFEAEGKHYITIWFQAKLWSGEAVVAAADEMSEVGWFGWDDLPTPLFLPLRNLLDGKGYRETNVTSADSLAPITGDVPKNEV